VEPRDAILAAAERSIETRIGPLVARHGFRRRRDRYPAELEDSLVSRTWRRAPSRGRPQWVHASVSVDYRDEPYFVRILIGEGDPESFLDQELYGLALWQLVEARDPAQDRAYEILNAEHVDRVVESVALDLERYAGDFLAGDLTTYRRLRRPIPPFPRVVVVGSIVGQLALMPWRIVLWVLRRGPRRMGELDRALRRGERADEGEVRGG
jgi:hypothetical protein